MRFVEFFSYIFRHRLFFSLISRLCHLTFHLQNLKSPEETESFTKKNPPTKMNQGMETLRQLATTSLFLQSEKNNISNHVPTVKINTGMFEHSQSILNDILLMAFFRSVTFRKYNDSTVAKQ